MMMMMMMMMMMTPSHDDDTNAKGHRSETIIPHSCSLPQLLKSAPVRSGIIMAKLFLRGLSMTASAQLSRTAATSIASQHSLIDYSRASPSFARDSLYVIPDIITPEEEKSLVAECEVSLRRRRYQRGHWDNVSTYPLRSTPHSAQ